MSLQMFITLMHHSLQTEPTVNKIVVVTHTAPDKDFLFDDNPSLGRLSASYANSQYSEVIQTDINKKISCWCFGHTHKRHDTVKDHIRYINNARGYPGEKFNTEPWEVKQIDLG